MAKLQPLRIGVIGVGVMGGDHARKLKAGKARGAVLAAICDSDPLRLDALKELAVPAFDHHLALLDSGLCDAVIVATPHYWHPPQTIAAARRGIHVLCEKPIAVTIGPARQMVAECRRAGVVFGVMFMQRLRPWTRKMLQIVKSGQLGEIFRVSMIGSSWYRSQFYYSLGAWRGTWVGEGGGILMNQAPHSLDQYQEVAGLPKQVIAHVQTRTHSIEVENTANAILDYGDGKVGYFYATTAESPGKEELIVSGSKATLVAAGGQLRLARLKMPLDTHIHTSQQAFGHPGFDWREIAVAGQDPSHMGVVSQFVKAVRDGAPLVADGQDGINEVELCNAIYLAGFSGKPVSLPLDETAIEKLITRLARQRGKQTDLDLRTPATRELKALLAAKTAKPKPPRKSVP